METKDILSQFRYQVGDEVVYKGNQHGIIISRLAQKVDGVYVRYYNIAPDYMSKAERIKENDVTNKIINQGGTHDTFGNTKNV